ncbi:MAG: phosphoribosylformylglycinamidine synthase, partial [Clostridiales bacterium]|nr:phosphoribosylformylglycinamidine synthase [Clostridiales bacterium]
MVYRLYVEKKPGFRQEADALARDIRSFLRISELEDLRLINRYDVEDIAPELLKECECTVFSEPQLDDVYAALPDDGSTVFAVEPLPGQFDQRADSAAQCVQLVSTGERPTVRTAKVYLIYGALSGDQLAAVKAYLMNPVDSREAALALPDTLKLRIDAPRPVAVVEGFIDLADGDLHALRGAWGLAMDAEDLKCCRAYFQREGRDPTVTELRVLDTYWSDHCRHTTFLTAIERAEIADERVAAAYNRARALRAELNRDGPMTLMELATLGGRALRARGLLTDEDASDEINACTVRIDVKVGGETEKWLLLFQNETHNHPTEIEPFGGAATCIGGAIRDPLSGRGYVYHAMRVTGAADPLAPINQTLPGKLPQRKLTTTAAAGFSAYGNQIGLATGLVDEIYHPGYAAKRMEIGAVIGAAPADAVRRETPAPGDVVVLLGGRTGRDGCGGATGSSKSHDAGSLTSCGAEVQKGNAPEERKLQRLFR